MKKGGYELEQTTRGMNNVKTMGNDKLILFLSSVHHLHGKRHRKRVSLPAVNGRSFSSLDGPESSPAETVRLLIAILKVETGRSSANLCVATMCHLLVLEDTVPGECVSRSSASLFGLLFRILMTTG